MCHVSKDYRCGSCMMAHQHIFSRNEREHLTLTFQDRWIDWGGLHVPKPKSPRLLVIKNNQVNFKADSPLNFELKFRMRCFRLDAATVTQVHCVSNQRLPDALLLPERCHSYSAHSRVEPKTPGRVASAWTLPQLLSSRPDEPKTPGRVASAWAC
ncbi:hypothetical protein ANN_06324 [Periplaneta americana]|uniref:Uncharacterized protein n=1 Tax=Periplaneta americana TaxID=6978 RepID=A0ABQ8TFA0_PERAM|nr:hypothetical protein ANN_06324 [Periplaneta americana]